MNRRFTAEQKNAIFLAHQSGEKLSYSERVKLMAEVSGLSIDSINEFVNREDYGRQRAKWYRGKRLQSSRS